MEIDKVGEVRCEKLRWKGMFTDSPRDPSIQPCNDRSFWCQHTYTCLGPDGKVVNEFECNAARKCYEEL